MTLTAIIFASLSGVSIGTLVYLIIAYISLTKKMNKKVEEYTALLTAFDEIKLNYAMQEKVVQTITDSNKELEKRVQVETGLRQKAEVQRDENFKNWAKTLSASELADHFNKLMQTLS